MKRSKWVSLNLIELCITLYFLLLTSIYVFVKYMFISAIDQITIGASFFSMQCPTVYEYNHDVDDFCNRRQFIMPSN